jgi:uncharacterized protein with FMN-binding domain
MGGTKIFVVQLKEMLKSAAFALIGIIVIILLVYFFIPKEKPQSTSLYIPGTYSSEIILNNNPVLVEVGVSEDKILSVRLKDMDEVQETFYPVFKTAMEDLSKEIVETQRLDVPMSQETAVTQQILLSAVRAALDKAENTESAEKGE